MKFGERLSELRKDSGLKQKDIADLLSVAVSTVSNYETASHEPDLDNLCKLADYFHVSADYLLGRTDITLDINALNEPINSTTTKADVLRMLETFSREDKAYLTKTIRLLHYYDAVKAHDKEQTK